MLEDLFHTKFGIILVSIIWGLGLATMFRKACKGRNCQVLVYDGPDPREIAKTYYEYGTGECYRYTPFLTPCG